MKPNIRSLLLVGLGVVIAIPLFLITKTAMVETSTPAFCSSCHEIQPAYNEWKTSSHAFNDKGVVAGCMDCHLPPLQHTTAFVYQKTYHGIKDVVGHFFGGDYDRSENRQHAYGSLQNRSCLKCHGNLLDMPYQRGAMLAHKTVLYPRDGYEKQCVDCHQNLVHNRSDLYGYRSSNRY